MKKGEKLQQQCDVCGKWLDKDISNFKRYSVKTNGHNFHTTCRECEKKIEENTEWKDNKLLCHICGEYLDPSEFDSSKSVNKIRDGKDRRCKKCKREQNKEARTKYSDEERLYKILQSRWLGARDRAKAKSIPFTITKEDLFELWNKQEGLCALSKIPMTFELDKGRIYSNVSIDQIEPSKGYTKDNIQLVCMAINQLKSDFDLNIVYLICKNIVDNIKTLENEIVSKIYS